MTVSKKTLCSLVALDKLMEVEVENEIIERLLIEERKPVNVRYKKKILTGHLSNSVWLEKKENFKFTAILTRSGRCLTRFQSHKSNVNF